MVKLERDIQFAEDQSNLFPDGFEKEDPLTLFWRHYRLSNAMWRDSDLGKNHIVIPVLLHIKIVAYCISSYFLRFVLYLFSYPLLRYSQ
ncbi:hypothetical protein M514_14894 [Trichuris suis]|uniref:Uncharacterized protein n=1 Tax=Trichuris suis TaxID=68888 RepID=A0A085NU44_9BILA|nr:hypothetical protein M514_14894 [Trichuris suis]